MSFASDELAGIFHDQQMHDMRCSYESRIAYIEQVLDQRTTEANELSEVCDGLQRGAAREAAFSSALQIVVQHFWPKHPLFADAQLRERIKSAGERAFDATNEFEKARAAVHSVKVPDFDYAAPFTAELQQRVSELEARNAALSAEVARLRAAR